MNDAKNIHQLSIKPKEAKRQYRRHEITLRYMTQEKTWSWEFNHTTTLSFCGHSTTMDKALRVAKKEVDALLDGV